MVTEHDVINEILSQVYDKKERNIEPVKVMLGRAEVLILKQSCHAVNCYNFEDPEVCGLKLVESKRLNRIEVY